MVPRRRAAGLLVAALLGLTGCSGLQGTDGKQYVAGDGQIVTFDREDRGAPVSASGEAVDGGRLDLADFRGRVVIANVWWSQCGPCRKEMPILVDIADDLGAETALIGINVRETGVDNARAFQRGVGVDFPSFFDPGGEVLLAFSDDLGPRSIPSTAVLDRQGRLAALVLGEVPGPATLKEIVEDIVAEPEDADRG
jgi:thiol-disulfide isomerase/thioredoxin